MKKHILIFLIMFGFMPLLITGQALHVITVTNFQFSPSPLTGVKIGDTIEWSWVSGSHTVTSTSVPATAASFNFSMNSGSTLKKYVISVSGTYNYECQFHVVSENMTGSFVVDAATSISRMALKDWSLEPNPATDFVNISVVHDINGNAKINVYDLLGRKVLSTDIELNSNGTNYTLDVTGLKNGIYLVFINSGAIQSKPLRMIKR